MIALVVDDEKPMLEALHKAVKASPDISGTTAFMTCQEALEWVTCNKPDIAFLDINMRGMGGIALAQRIMEIHNDCKVIFCTGYSEYAIEAFRMHASGYLLKPITEEAIQREIDHIKSEEKKRYSPPNTIEQNIPEKTAVLRVQCFGNFEVFNCATGEPVHFARQKSKEAFAYLVYRNGASCTVKEIAAVIFEDAPYDTQQQRYIQKIISAMLQALRAVNAEKVIIRSYNNLALNTSLIDCDSYSAGNIWGEQEKAETEKRYKKEFMAQYSWAEY